ncbi:aminotransferase class V-fold PLP-dependent enzyme [Streptomyces sp. NPDC050147]|uniref:aminotransferase class V-fold PLP-dependent enzyme n=1 Tax=Streptomyces sp. NPDC050147 TaxID=3155513 RepID=UPI00342D5474
MLGGGNMIESVSFERTTCAAMPHMVEAGTGNVSGVVGLLAAIDWLRGFDQQAVAAYEQALKSYARTAMASVPGVEVIGSAAERIAVLTFTLAGPDPAPVADWLDRDGIAVRAGHHCAQPALAHYGLESAARASLALYNTSGEVDQLMASLRRLQEAGSRRRRGLAGRAAAVRFGARGRQRVGRRLRVLRWNTIRPMTAKAAAHIKPKPR